MVRYFEISFLPIQMYKDMFLVFIGLLYTDEEIRSPNTLKKKSLDLKKMIPGDNTLGIYYANEDFLNLSISIAQLY